MMASDLPCGSYMALYIVSMHILNTNSRTSTHWKLDTDSGKVQAAALAADGGESIGATGSAPDDPLLSLLTNKITLDNGEWRLESEEPTCSDDSCQKFTPGGDHEEKNKNGFVFFYQSNLLKCAYSIPVTDIEKLGYFAIRKKSLRACRKMWKPHK